MSLDSLEAHNQKWDALPAFPAWPYVMRDDDVDAWGDIRGLADAICGAATIKTRIDQFPPHFRDDSVVFNPDSPAYVPWPADRAAQLLADWQLEVSA